MKVWIVGLQECSDCWNNTIESIWANEAQAKERRRSILRERKLPASYVEINEQDVTEPWKDAPDEPGLWWWSWHPPDVDLVWVKDHTDGHCYDVGPGESDTRAEKCRHDDGRYFGSWLRAMPPVPPQ